MYEVEANSMGCTFEKEEDAIKAFMMALAMEEDINISELEKKIKYDLNNTKNNMYEHNYYMSIRKVNWTLIKKGMKNMGNKYTVVGNFRQPHKDCEGETLTDLSFEEVVKIESEWKKEKEYKEVFHFKQD